jgi:hypothetical protein
MKKGWDKRQAVPGVRAGVWLALLYKAVREPHWLDEET